MRVSPASFVEMVQCSCPGRKGVLWHSTLLSSSSFKVLVMKETNYSKAADNSLEGVSNLAYTHTSKLNLKDKQQQWVVVFIKTDYSIQ